MRSPLGHMPDGMRKIKKIPARVSFWNIFAVQIPYFRRALSECFVYSPIVWLYWDACNAYVSASSHQNVLR